MTIYDLQPVEDKIIVVQDEAQEVTKGGIILADASKEAPSRGEVIATGPGKWDPSGNFVKPPVSVGGGVYFTKFGGSTILLDGKKAILLRPEHILAVYDRSKADEGE